MNSLYRLTDGHKDITMEDEIEKDAPEQNAEIMKINVEQLQTEFDNILARVLKST